MADPNQYQAPINNGVAAQVKSPSSRALEPVKEGWGATKTLPAAFGDPAREVLDRLNELRCYPTLCDVTLIAGGSRLTAHRAILASASHYFLAMFTSGMKEGRAAEVEIGHVQFDVLKTIVDSIYSRTLEITIENVQDLLAAASLLQVSSVVSQCCDFLLNHLDDQNCLGIRAFLTSNGCMETAHRTDMYILNNFPEVSVCEEFVTYPLELLLPILRNDLLNVECEEQVLEAVLRWYNHHEGYCNTGANISSSAMSAAGLRGSFCPMSRLQSTAATSVSIAGRASSLAPKSGSLYKSQEQQHRYPRARSLCHCGRCHGHGNKHRQCPEIGSLVNPLTQCRPQAVTTTAAAAAAAAQTSPGSPNVVATLCQQPCRCACSPTTQQQQQKHQQQQQRQSPLQQQQHSCSGPEGNSASDATSSTTTTNSIASSTATTNTSSRSSNVPATDSVQVVSAASAVSITSSTSTAAAGVSSSTTEHQQQGEQIPAVAGAASYKPTLSACAVHVQSFPVSVVDGNTAANQTSPSVQARRSMSSAGPPRMVSMIGTWSQSYADGETAAAEEASQEVSAAAAASQETSAAAASTAGTAQELVAGDAQWPSSLQAQGTVTSAGGVCGGGGCWAFPPASQSAPPPAPAPLSSGSLRSGSSSTSSSLPLSTSHEFLPYSSTAATAASEWDANPCTVEAQSTSTAAPPAAVGASHHIHGSPPVSHSSTTAASPHSCNTMPGGMLARATAEHEERLRRSEHRTRSEHALALLRTLRLVHLSKRSLLEQVGTFPAFRNSMECRNVLDLANRFHLLDEGPARWDMRSRLEMCRPRKSVRGTVFALGGKKSSEHISDSMEIFNSRSGSWTQGPTLLRRRQQLGVVYHNGSIYVIGGSDGVSRLNSVHSWNLRTKDWEVRASLASPRSGVGVGVLEGAIYAAGGYDGHMCLDSVERYDEVNDRWSFVAPMHKRRSFPAVAALTGRLIVVGGNDGTTFLSVAEAYEPHHDRWQSIAHLQKPRAGIGAATLFGCLYVCGGNDGAARLDSVEVYDPDRNEWKLVRPMLAARDGACLCALGSSLVVLGGINGPAYLNTVEEYDPISDTWTFLTSMDVCRVAGGVAVVPTADMVEFSKPASSKDTSRSPALMGPGEAGRVAQDMALRVLNNAANE